MKELLAIATLIGTIIGVGMFGAPYAAMSAGFSVAALQLVAVTALIIAMHVLYGEIVLRTPGTHRFVGYAKRYLGSTGRALAMIIGIVGSFTALLAYVLVGGAFVFQFVPIMATPRIASFFVLFIGMILVLAGIKTLAWIELLMAAVLIAVMCVVLGVSFPLVQPSNFAGVASDMSTLFLPFGVLLFALGGTDAIPGMKDILTPSGKQTTHSRRFRSIIIIGTVIPAVLTLGFMASVVGVSGPETSIESISGLRTFFTPSIITLLSIFGFIAVFTSFLVIADNVKKTLWKDFGMNKWLSWAIVFAVLFGLFLLNGDFIGIIQFGGAAVGGIVFILILLMHRNAQKRGQRKPEYSWKHTAPVITALAIIFGLGAAYQLWLDVMKVL